jgi:hypothetical protein
MFMMCSLAMFDQIFFIQMQRLAPYRRAARAIETCRQQGRTGQRGRWKTIAVCAALQALPADATLAVKSEGKDRANGRAGR